MRKFTSKRSALLAVVGVLAISAAAIAYWTTTGSGTGSATTGTAAAVTVTQVGTITGLVPGGAAQPVDFKITNPKTTPQYVTGVSYTIASIKKADNTDATGCSAADFTLVQPSAITADLAAGDTSFAPSGATLAMKNLGTNQDGCKNVTVNLAFSAV
jgi:hypothetical protein